MRQMATLKLGLFKTPRDELADTVDGDVPEWIERIYQSHGTTATSAPASVSVLALSESLGFRLRRLAHAGASVRAVVRNPSGDVAGAAVIQADLLEVATLAPALAGIKSLIHCAAITADHKEPFPGAYRRVNAEGTRNLVWAARRAGGGEVVSLDGPGTRRG